MGKPAEDIVIYDMAIDEMRPATQADVDRLQQVAQCYGALRHLLRGIVNNRPGDINHRAFLERLVEATNVQPV